MSVEQEVCGITNLTRFPSESEQAFYGRVLKKLDQLPDEYWHSMGKEAQEWASSAIIASNANRPIPSFPEGEEEAESTETKPKKRPVKASAANIRVKELLLERPGMSSREIHKRVLDEGYDISFISVQVERGAFRSALSFLKERGLIDVEI